MSVGRNDPCPCGSGKKYKKCCLPGEQAPPEELFWHRLKSSRSDLISKIMEHTFKTYGELSLHEAWNEFHQWRNIPFDPSADENQLFMPWFFYDWIPDSDNSDLPISLPDVPPAKSLLDTKGRYLEPLQKDYIETCLKSPFSFFEIIECRPGEGFRVCDVFTLESLDVVEKMGSQSASIGDIFFGKPVTVNGLTTMEATSPIMIPPIHKGPFLELRKQIHRVYKKITKETLYEYRFEFLELYREFHDQFLNPTLPKLCNTDGDPMHLQKLFFEIESARDAFDALKDLNFEETEESLLKEARFDLKKNLIKIEFPWLRKGNKQNKAWSNTVLGHISIEQSNLSINVNSDKRARLFRKIIVERLGDKAKYKTTIIEPLEAISKKRPGQGNSIAAPARKNQEQLLAQNPEINAKMAEIMAAHWDGWIDAKVPALGNKTPIQASKTKEGKEMLHALLTQFEREAVNRPQPGVNVHTFTKIRKRLGLTSKKQ